MHRGYAFRVVAGSGNPVSKLDVRMRERRKAAGLTQAELAEIVGVSRKTVNTVENGVFVPSTLLALELADALECRVEDLFSLPRLRSDNAAAPSSALA